MHFSYAGNSIRIQVGDQIQWMPQIHRLIQLIFYTQWICRKNLLSVASLQGFSQLKTKKAMHFSYAGNSIRIQVGDQIQWMTQIHRLIQLIFYISESVTKIYYP
jgi:plastocyanin